MLLSMWNLNKDTPVAFLVWSLAIFLFAIVARLGWEVGEKVWSIF